MSPGRRFQRKHRLTSAADFSRVFKTSRRSRDSQFVILARDNDRAHSRLGLAISRKAVKTAVARNRVKRVIRANFREHAELLAGLDVVVLAQKAIRPGENNAMSQSLRTHWRRIRKCGR